MGAELWHHSAPWKPDPEDALLDLQTDFLARNYDLPALLKRSMHSAREVVRDCEANGDEYGLLEMYRERVEILQEAARRPIPVDPRERIELVRQIYSDSGQGVGNVLDVTGISDRGGMDARRLQQNEVRRYCGTDRPTIKQAENAVGAINEVLSRGESVCFPVFDKGVDDGSPVGWYFVGNTID